MTATAPPSPVIDPSPGSSDARRGWNAATERQHLKVFQALAELGVLALALGTTASLNRLFIGWSFLGSLAIPVVGSWLTALVMRRLRVPVLAALAVSILVGVVVLTLQFAPGTSMVGLPTGRSIDAVRAALDESFGGFNRMIAPVDATNGFLVMIAGILWLFGFFADTAAFRYSSPVQAVVPYAAAFVAIGILARQSGRIGAASFFLVGLGIYAVTQRALRATEQRWIRSEAGKGATAVASAAGGLALAALVIGLVVSPLLPDTTDPVLDLRALGRPGDARTVTSPFVGVRSLLGQQSDAVMFDVQASQPAYWRLTSLERFDEQRGIWVSEGTYRKVSGELDASPTEGGEGRIDQTVTIDDLESIWLPSAFTPVSVDNSSVDVSFDDDSSSIIARGTSLRPDMSYEVSSVVADVTAAALAGSAEGNNLEPVYHEKASLSPEVEQLTREVVASAVSPYDKAIALQNWFRENFVYDQTVNYSDAADPVQQFIDDRAGFCQQFSSTFALMTRSLGMASRVAVGFTPGDVVDLKQEGSLVGSDQGGDQPVPGYLVRGRHAHAWPEIYFDGVGWIPFEPTPGRGNPQAVDYSGVAPDQAPTPPEQAATTTLPTVTTTPESEQPGAQNDNVNVTDQPTPEAAAGEQGSNSVLRWLLWLIAAVAIVAAVVIIGRTIVHAHRRSHARHDPHGGRVASAWEETLSWLALLGIRPRTSETPVEFTARARPIVGIAALDALADAETTRRFGPADPTQQQCHAAETAASSVRERVRAATTRMQRARRVLR